MSHTDAWRHHAYEGVLNFRDFGGYGCARGGLPRGRLYRSAHHHRASDADLETFHSLGVGLVVDLRTDAERREQPSRRHAAFAARVIEATGEQERAPHHVVGDQAVIDEDDVRRAMTASYRDLAYRPGIVDAYRRTFEALADRPTPVLIHCAAGKDRTGVLVALLQRAAGVAEDDVMADYLLTNRVEHPPERIERFGRWMSERYGGAHTDAAIRLALGVEPGFLEATWASMDERNGGVNGYLRDVLGVDDAKREAAVAALYA